MDTATDPGPGWLGEGLLAPLEGGMMGITEGKVGRMAEIFFSGASSEDIEAYGQLLRPQPPGYVEAGLELTASNFGSVNKVFLLILLLCPLLLLCRVCTAAVPAAVVLTASPAAAVNVPTAAAAATAAAVLCVHCCRCCCCSVRTLLSMYPLL